jgi:hypothetical protein
MCGEGQLKCLEGAETKRANKWIVCDGSMCTTGTGLRSQDFRFPLSKMDLIWIQFTQSDSGGNENVWRPKWSKQILTFLSSGIEHLISGRSTDYTA